MATYVEVLRRNVLAGRMIPRAFPAVLWYSFEQRNCMRLWPFSTRWDAHRLIHHIANADWETMRSEIWAGLKVNGKSRYGRQTALIYASSCASRGGVQVLLEAHADVNAKDKNGKTALMHAAGGDSCYSDVVIVNLLLAAGADVHLRDKNGSTALHHTAFYETEKPFRRCFRDDIARVLITAGADANARNKRGVPALDPDLLPLLQARTG